MTVAVALDIGATKLAAALVDGTGAILAASRIRTRDAASRPVPALRELITSVAAPVGLDTVAGIGISSAGPLDLTAGTVAPVNIPELHGIALLERLSELVPGRPTRLTGDGLAAAAGEHWTGSGQGCDNLLAIVVSSGVGGGLILGGRLHGGASGNAGHVGHAPVVVDGEPCVCGARGCPEAYASGPSMVRWALRTGWRPQGTGDAVELAAAARTGDRYAVEAFERGGRALGAMIAATVAICDVNLVIIGGGVAQAGTLLTRPLRRSLTDHAVLPFTAAIQLVPARLGPDASLVGAAALIHRGDVYAPDGVGPGRATATVIAS
jgi:glucokinase